MKAGRSSGPIFRGSGDVKIGRARADRHENVPSRCRMTPPSYISSVGRPRIARAFRQPKRPAGHSGLINAKQVKARQPVYQSL